MDDEVIIADNLCTVLKRLGYDPLEPALSYAEAVKRLSTEPIELIVLDINLKTQNTGIDLAKHVRQELNIPIIFVTAYSDNKTLGQVKSVNPDGYIVKPYEPASIFTAVELAYHSYAKNINHQAEERGRMGISFTESEKKILVLIGENLSTKEIADKLFVSQSTVKNHRHNICAKLDLQGETHSLLKWVIENQKWIKNMN